MSTATFDSSQAMSLKTKRAPWWLELIGGILTIIVGALLLTSPAKTLVALAFALGVYWLFSGIWMLISMFIDHSAWGWKLIMGILGIIAGFFLIRSPIAGAAALPAVVLFLLAFQALFTGIMMLVLGFGGGGAGSIILGIIGIVFGVILLLNATNPAWKVSLVWVAAIFAIVAGGFQVVRAIIGPK